jgi:hypothetical protein
VKHDHFPSNCVMIRWFSLGNRQSFPDKVDIPRSPKRDSENRSAVRCSSKESISGYSVQPDNKAVSISRTSSSCWSSRQCIKNSVPRLPSLKPQNTQQLDEYGQVIFHRNTQMTASRRQGDCCQWATIRTGASVSIAAENSDD